MSSLIRDKEITTHPHIKFAQVGGTRCLVFVRASFALQYAEVLTNIFCFDSYTTGISKIITGYAR